jgi:hypothetical protein
MMMMMTVIIIIITNKYITEFAFSCYSSCLQTMPIKHQKYTSQLWYIYVYIYIYIYVYIYIYGKGKAVSLHAMEALGERGGIAPTHSQPRH